MSHAKSISPNETGSPRRVLGPSSEVANEWLEQSIYAARILIIDDDEPSASALCRILKQAGYENCVAITDPVAALDQFLDLNPDLVLLDLHMEPVSGFDVLKRMNNILQPSNRPPILVLTADTTLEAKHEALWMGASDFLSKPLDHLEVLLRINHLLTGHNLFRRCQLYSGGLERLVDKRTAELQRQTADLEKTLAELRETQWQVVQQERMRALGTMACGIAHDLNNGLTVILGYGDALLADRVNFPADSPQRKCLEEILLAGADNAKLVARLRDFYRPSAPHEHQELANLNELVEQAIELTAPKWQGLADAAGATIHIEKELGAISPILATPAELREVLTNLIFNAVDAMPGGGWLRFYTQQSGNQILLDISDTGIGMTEETVGKCLEPFFTTKGERGSGLGLTTSYGIIRRHGGNIDISSKVGQGTTFTISLPAFDEQHETVPVRPQAQTMQSLHILVV
ncbi:MAG TPA: ATP-binding protein, partial [Chthoniobacterales bacterium]|nr:ATP-binding protein [Chthoniobacterales bacterium]